MATETLQKKLEIEKENIIDINMIKTEESSRIKSITFSKYPEEKELSLNKN